jgi:hypothetical protein
MVSGNVRTNSQVEFLARRAAWAHVVVRVAGGGWWVAAVGLLLLDWGLRPGP